MDNDRRTLRLKIREKIEIHNSKTFVTAHLLDISAGGVFMETEAPLPIDAQCALRLHIPGDNKTMDILGHVVWIKQASNSFPAGMGIHFSSLTPDQTVTIQKYMRALHQSNRQ